MTNSATEVNPTNIARGLSATMRTALLTRHSDPYWLDHTKIGTKCALIDRGLITTRQLGHAVTDLGRRVAEIAEA